MKICHFWKVNHAHSGGSYYILMKYLGSKYLPPHHRCIAHKKNPARCPKNNQKDPKIFRILALHKGLCSRMRSTSNDEKCSSHLTLNLIKVGL